MYSNNQKSGLTLRELVKTLLLAALLLFVSIGYFWIWPEIKNIRQHKDDRIPQFKEEQVTVPSAAEK